jgi:hypothetical protein
MPRLLFNEETRPIFSKHKAGANQKLRGKEYFEKSVFNKAELFC